MKLYPAARYISHFVLARHRNGHGVHSPFFFEIINTLQRNKSNDELVYKAAEAWRRELISDKRSILVTDLGTGTGGYKRVCDIAGTSSVSSKLGRVLSYFAKRAGNRPIIELGTSLGIGTMYMALANRDTRIITIEGCKEISSIAAEGFTGSDIFNVEIVTGNFDDHIQPICEKIAAPGLVYIDGNHRGDALNRYFNQFASCASEETVIIADDIDYSSDMSTAWTEIENDPRVTGSIDIGRAGILFFKKGFPKQRYRVRY
jgi:predicted O-methyltransferase YrrM